jgi:hypothetical protein
MEQVFEGLIDRTRSTFDRRQPSMHFSDN